MSEVHTIPILEDRDLIAGFVGDILVPVLEERDLTGATLGIDHGNTFRPAS